MKCVSILLIIFIQAFIHFLFGLIIHQASHMYLFLFLKNIHSSYFPEENSVPGWKEEKKVAEWKDADDLPLHFSLNVF